MNRQIIKKLILCLMTVILCVTTCAPAFASKGDRTLMHFSDEESACISMKNELRKMMELMYGLTWKYE